MGLAFCAAFSYAAMFAFLTAGSFVYIGLYGVSPQNFGYLFGLNVITIMIITAINGRYVSRFGVSRLLEISLVIQSTGGVLMVFAWRMDLGICGLVPFVMLMVGNVALIYSNSMSLLLSRYPTLIGTASSVIGTLRYGTATVIGAIVAALHSNSAGPMTTTMALCGILSLGSYWIWGRQ